ncbi:MAG TPA: hypothetical protein VK021_06060 [Flavobacteriaceae bacterium]|nr:hypothetical protein [Flavobacteriaceae bacterium]
MHNKQFCKRVGQHLWLCGMRIIYAHGLLAWLKMVEPTGMNRPSFYKTLSDGAKPQLETIMKVLKATGGQINVRPISG